MSTKTNFLLPYFDKNIPNKINEDVEVKSQHVLSINSAPNWHSAIATSGFSSKTDGVYVFATKLDNIVNGDLIVGFTDVKTYDSKKNGSPGDDEFTGTSLNCGYGERYHGDVPYLSSDTTRKAKEIVSILIISSNGCKKEIQWIVDGHEGPIHDVTKDFGKGDEIFPCISFGDDEQQVELIPFDKVKSRSPKIHELMKEYKKRIIQITTSAPSTSTAANDALISQLRDQVGRSQVLLMQQSQKRIQQLEQLMQQQLSAKDHQLQQQNAIWQQQLSVKDQQHERAQREARDSFLGQLDLCHKQLELERAEHQKTRNLLHQIKMELKDMEIYYLTKEKESGQRRQREEENHQFKVKQEPGIEEEEKQSKRKTASKSKKK